MAEYVKSPDEEYAAKIRQLVVELNETAKLANDYGLEVLFREVDMRVVNRSQVNSIAVKIRRPL